MKKIVNIFLVAVTLFAVASCQHNRKVSVKADFTTDKTVYELYEDIKVTNVSAATNDIIVACKWEWGSEHVYGKQLEKPISFDSVGEKEIKLTVTTDTGAQDVCVKTVTVQDTNVRPVADFEWTPADGIAAGDEVQFTDKSTDADGTIVAWEWKFGANTVTEQNPKYAFPVFGDIEVTLTVTDNQRGKGSVKKVIHVAKSPNSLELAWAKAYDSDSEAYAKFTSPATNADGSVVYAFSSGLHLVAFDADGTQKWSFDANIHNPNPRSNDGTKTGSSCTPSVDKDGTIFIALAYNEAGDASSESGVYAINPDGTQKWYFKWNNAKYINVIPVILDEKIFLATKSNPSDADLWTGKPYKDNGTILNKATGAFDQVIRVKQGSYGGFAATKEEAVLFHTNDTYGTRIIWKQDDGTWKYYGADGGRDKFMLGRPVSGGNPDCGFSTYMAIDKNNKAYILYGKTTGENNSTPVLYCYDLTKYSATDGISPEWTMTDLAGTVNRYYSHGTVLGEDGTIYVTTRKGLAAINPDGTKKWNVDVSNDNFSIWGCPAVDNQGYIYFNESEQVGSDQTTGKLVKVKPDGTRASELVLGTSLRTSPTISPDGTIYCTGMKDGKVTLFAVKGSATGPGAGWSQLGGNPRKSCKAE